MYEFGTRIKNDKSGEEIRIFFSPLSYLDWVVYSEPPASSDPAAIRALFRKYVKRVISWTGNDKDEKIERPIDWLLDLDAPAIEKVVSIMISKSGFSNEEKTYEELIKKMEGPSHRIMGAYDNFLFVHLSRTNPELYIRLLHEDAYVRGHVISVLQEHTGINVASRFQEAIQLKTDLDLAYGPAEHASMLKQKSMRNNNNQVFRDKKPVPSTPVPPHMGVNLEDMVSDSTAALKELMAKRQQHAKSFDWQSDELKFGSSEQKSTNDVLNNAPDRKFNQGK